LDHKRAKTIEISELLLRCLQAEYLIEKAPDNEELLVKIDWLRFLEQVSYHRLVPVVYESLGKFPEGFFPDEIIESLRQYNLNNKRRVLRLSFELLKLARLLEKHNIPAIFFKGPVLSHVAYGSLEQRMFDDLDVLVKERDYLKPKELLVKEGYLPLDYPTLSVEESDRFRYYAGEYTLTQPNGVVCLDIHSQLLGGGILGLSKSFSTVWERLIYTKISNQELPTLCLEDQLIYLSLNGLKEGWVSLKSVCDIDRLVRNYIFDWDLVSERARAEEANRALCVGLLISSKLLNTPLPTQAEFLLVDEKQARDVANYACSLIIQQIDRGTKRSSTATFKIVWATLQSWKDRKFYLLGVPKRVLSLMLAVNSYDMEFINLPKYLHFLYYPVRVLRVFNSYGLRVFQILLS